VAAIICSEVDHSQYFVVITPTTMGYFIVLCVDDGVASDLFSSEKRGMTKNINSICGAARVLMGNKMSKITHLSSSSHEERIPSTSFLQYSHSRLLLVCIFICGERRLFSEYVDADQ
jgi:hypothetical protein